MKNIGIALTALALTAAVPFAATAGSLTGSLGGSVGGAGGSVGGAGGSLGGGLSGGTSLGGNEASGVTAGTGATVGAALQAPAVTTPSVDSLPSTAAASAVTVNSKGRITNLSSVSSADLVAYFAAQNYTLASSFRQTAENTLEASAQLSGTPVTIDIDAHGNVTFQ
ncbi:hypothetical protein GCM10007874_41060 [Labrys miyagiensis]|uniref:Uncharacterized protein n=1 Tax=Labrys miyagiensis TaxID=346912 RepID=A0ABQ6CQW9_9HYPH|nr:hypothetical protein [Labrys miyagiensis]GLS21089.1 hypothetical protein GCM10007874_41060 [Labrys miyagiensis]